MELVEEKLTEKPYARLGFTKVDAKELVEKMNLLLANYSVHYQKLRNFHWNVTGSDFYDIHEQFENHYDEAIENIDEIAEKIRVFGMTPMSNMSDYLENSEIKESPSHLEANDMVKEILVDFEILVKHGYNVIDSAIEIGDLATEDLIKGMIKSIEMHHWMWTAFLKE